MLMFGLDGIYSRALPAPTREQAPWTLEKHSLFLWLCDGWGCCIWGCGCCCCCCCCCCWTWWTLVALLLLLLLLFSGVSRLKRRFRIASSVGFCTRSWSQDGWKDGRACDSIWFGWFFYRTWSWRGNDVQTKNEKLVVKANVRSKPVSSNVTPTTVALSTNMSSVKCSLH